MLCLTETWWTKALWWNTWRPRYSRRGCGTAIYMKKKIRFVVLTDLTLNLDYVESIFIKILTRLSYFAVGVCYKPPNLNLDKLMKFLEGRLSWLGFGGGNVVVCGDFNLDLLSLNENSSSQVFYNAMNAISLIPSIFKPTRIAGSSCMLIDNIFATNLSAFSLGIYIGSLFN